VIEYGGIPANPEYDSLMEGVAIGRKEKIDFLLSVGGGSVLDGTKFIAVAIPWRGADPWDIVVSGKPAEDAIPIGCVLTLPATGSEMNCFAVISRASRKEKRAFSNPHVYPRFSVLDPETTFTLPPRQVANGIVDAFAHVMEQYMTFPQAAPLQDRQAEAILRTLIEIGPKTLAEPRDYDARASLVWCATQALNGLIGCGVAQDWATHMIGHELTALHGIDHAQSLAVVLPAILRHQKARKREKLSQFGRRVWGIEGGDADSLADQAIEKTEAFFRSLGVKTKLSEYGIPASAAQAVSAKLDARDAKLGEHEAIRGPQVAEILRICA